MTTNISTVVCDVGGGSRRGNFGRAGVVDMNNMNNVKVENIRTLVQPEQRRAGDLATKSVYFDDSTLPIIAEKGEAAFGVNNGSSDAYNFDRPLAAQEMPEMEGSFGQPVNVNEGFGHTSGIGLAAAEPNNRYQCRLAHDVRIPEFDLYGAGEHELTVLEAACQRLENNTMLSMQQQQQQHHNPHNNCSKATDDLGLFLDSLNRDKMQQHYSEGGNTMKSPPRRSMARLQRRSRSDGYFATPSQAKVHAQAQAQFSANVKARAQAIVSQSQSQQQVHVEGVSMQELQQQQQPAKVPEEKKITAKPRRRIVKRSSSERVIFFGVPQFMKDELNTTSGVGHFTLAELMCCLLFAHKDGLEANCYANIKAKMGNKRSRVSIRRKVEKIVSGETGLSGGLLGLPHDQHKLVLECIWNRLKSLIADAESFGTPKLKLFASQLRQFAEDPTAFK